MMAARIVRFASLAIVLDGTAALAEPDDAARERSDQGAVAADDGALVGRLGPRPPSGRFEVGAGFSTDDGFVARAAVVQDNLFGRGQTLALSAQLTRRRELFLIHFAEPQLGGSDLGLSVDLYSDRQLWPGFERTATGGALSLHHPLGARTRGFLTYRLEEVAVEAPGAAITARALEPGRWDPSLLLRGGRIGSLRAGLEHDSRDQPLAPRRGTSAGAWLEVADQSLGSDFGLARGRAWVGHHRPLGPFTLHLGAGLGAVTSSDPRGVPLSERLQLDGASELRGFAPGQLGRLDPHTGIALGGNAKLTGRAELEFPLVPRFGLSGVVFADAGAVIDLEGRARTGLGAAVGVGLLWRGPLGPVRLDLSLPVSDRDRSSGFTVGIGLGF
jgi:outer membrane protein insertion porin family